MVSAFAARQRLVLGQVKVDEKSNEIVAIPKLLDMLVIEGAIVTIDAMGGAAQGSGEPKDRWKGCGGCQRDIAQKILDKGGDYVLALKGNQNSLHDDIKLFATEQKARNFYQTRVSQHSSTDGDHGRIETRKCTVLHDVKWLQKRHNWPGLRSVAIIDSTREIGTNISRETRFYITSCALVAEHLAATIRSHWAIENSLHWTMDMVFRDDECRVRTDHAPANFTTIKHMAYNLIRKASSKDSIRVRRKAAAWDDTFLASLIG